MAAIAGSDLVVIRPFYRRAPSSPVNVTMPFTGHFAMGWLEEGEEEPVPMPDRCAAALDVEIYGRLSTRCHLSGQPPAQAVSVVHTPPHAWTTNMKPLQPALLTLYADLLQQLQETTLLAGSVRTQEVKGRDYLKANTTIGVQRTTLYIGAATDPEAKRKANAIQDEMQRARARRQTVGLLRRSGIPAPTTEMGRVLEVLASANLFRKGAVLVGTGAYQCYSPLVGTMLPAASMMTQDVDLATASLALSAGEGQTSEINSEDQTGGPGSSPSLEDILRRADPTFTGILGLTPAAFPSHFRAKSGFMVDILVPVRSRADPNPMPIPALRAAGAPLQHLDWLIDSPNPAAALYGAGVLVSVPQPARYAVHKLILAQKRGPASVKRQKDLDQAKALIEALKQTDPFAVADVLEDARSRGKRGWRDPIDRSLQQLRLTELAAS